MWVGGRNRVCMYLYFLLATKINFAKQISSHQKDSGVSGEGHGSGGHSTVH